MALQREAIEMQNKLKAAKKDYQDVHDRVTKKHGFNGAEVIAEVSQIQSIFFYRTFLDIFLFLFV